MNNQAGMVRWDLTGVNMSEKGYHFIGLGGIGMSALASILIDKKILVTGSDISENAVVKRLSAKGAHFTLGHSQNNVKSGQTVVYSSSVKQENPEMQVAKHLQCRLIHRSDLLKELMEGFHSLAVAGTHGKTTTSALLSHILTHAGWDPSYAIGGLMGEENGKSGKGKYFIAEVDESDGTFLKYHPFGAIITNVEKEHMDHYQNMEMLFDSFRKFFSQVRSPEHLFYCGDDPYLSALSQGKGISYGFNPDCQVQIISFCQKGWNIKLDICWEEKTYLDVSVPLVGKMHALNVTAVFALCLRLGMSEEKIREALLAFKGVKRRLEKKGEIKNVLVLDDYGHHPTEIEVTLAALKEAIGERRLIVIFQPHRFSRTRDLFDEFGKAFESADHVFITDIYGAQEEAISGVTATALVKKIEGNGTVPVEYLSQSCSESLKEILRPHDVVLTLGAGNITEFGPKLLKAIENLHPKKYRVGLIFGGRSAEHEISLRSCRYVLESLNREYYDISYFGIDKKGLWVHGEEAYLQLLEKEEISSSHAMPLLSETIVSALQECDLFFPVLHGPNGEDGTIQGFLETLGKPYAGPDFRSCAITMDKVLTKRLMMAAKVPTAAFISFGYRDWLRDQKALLIQLQELTYPLYVKPSRMGSSIGVSRVENEKELKKAIENAFCYDDLVLVEEGVVDGREFEFAVLGSYRGKIEVVAPAEKCSGGTFVDYSKKYSQNPTPTNVTPYLEPDLLKKGKEFVHLAYEAIGISCMSRIDCIVDRLGNFCFTEINAIPGMTRLSLFPKMWDREGVTASALMDRLILLGLERRRAQDRHETML